MLALNDARSDLSLPRPLIFAEQTACPSHSWDTNKLHYAEKVLRFIVEEPARVRRKTYTLVTTAETSEHRSFRS